MTTRVGILSDTHGYFNPALRTFFAECDELWHAGDWGEAHVMEAIQNFKPVKGVYGNIDGTPVRKTYPEHLLFQVEGLKILMTHIAGYPGKYAPGARALLDQHRPDVLVCGHSHILKVMRDAKRKLMFFNPGAAGNKGFHQVCTALRMKVDGTRMFDLEVWEQKRNQP